MPMNTPKNPTHEGAPGNTGDFRQKQFARLVGNAANNPDYEAHLRIMMLLHPGLHWPDTVVDDNGVDNE